MHECEIRRLLYLDLLMRARSSAANARSNKAAELRSHRNWTVPQASWGSAAFLTVWNAK